MGTDGCNHSICLFPPSSWKQFFTSSWHWEIPLPWNLVAKFHMGFPRQWILTGLWKLHPNVCSRMCTGSHSGNFCVLWLSYMKFYTQASTSFTMAIFFFFYKHWTEIPEKPTWSRLQLKLMQEPGWLPFPLITFQMGLQCIMINISL